MRAKTPIAANTAARTTVLVSIPLDAAFGVEIKVNWGMGRHQQGVSTTGRVATHSINIKAGSSIDYTDRVKAVRETLHTNNGLTEELGPREGRVICGNSTSVHLNQVWTIPWLLGSSYSMDICHYEAEKGRW